MQSSADLLAAILGLGLPTVDDLTKRSDSIRPQVEAAVDAAVASVSNSDFDTMAIEGTVIGDLVERYARKHGKDVEHIMLFIDLLKDSVTAGVEAATTPTTNL